MKLAVPMMMGVDGSDEQLTFLKQMGVDSTLLLFKDTAPDEMRENSPFTRLRGGPYYETEDLLFVKKWVESHGLKLDGLCTIANGNKRWEKIITGQSGRDEQIENFWIKSLKNMAKAELFTYPVNMNINKGCRLPLWRTSRENVGRGGTTIVRFDYEVLRNTPVTELGEISLEQMWDNVTYFIKAVMPVAEESGIRLAFHPFDPQVPRVAGISRILNSVESFDRLYQIMPCKANAITFCIGSFSQFLDNEGVYKAIRHFRDRIAFVHFRNVRGTMEKFDEVWPDEGQMDMLQAVKVLKEVGYKGCLSPDHTPESINDDALGHRSQAFTIGYLRGIMQGAEVEQNI
jgi:mannonate dehydratase